MKSERISGLSYNDLLVLHELRKNSRISLAEISRKTSIPVSTIFDKIDRFNGKLIEKYVPILNFTKLGYIKVMYIAKASKKDRLLDFLDKHKNINTISKVNNGSDFIVDAVFENLADAQEFRESLASLEIEKINEHFIVEDIKSESFFTDESHIRI